MPQGWLNLKLKKLYYSLCVVQFLCQLFLRLCAGSLVVMSFSLESKPFDDCNLLYLHHGCANHDTEGKHFKSPICCCDVTKPPYLFSGELCTSSCTVNSCLWTPCVVGAPVSASLCSEHVNQTSYWRSGRQYWEKLRHRAVTQCATFAHLWCR